MVQKQAITGLALLALDKISKQNKLPLQILYNWIALDECIKSRNLLLNKRCVELTNFFEENNFDCCILKGQGNARLYPHPLCRESGDIDIWVKGEKENIISFVKTQYPYAEDTGYHIDFPVFNDVEVEVHYRPSYIRSPKYNILINDYYNSRIEEQFSNRVSLNGVDGYVNVPTFDFNVIYQLVHIMHHFFDYGLGLRQIIDYYYLLDNYQNKDKRTEIEYIIKELHLQNIAGAVMWVLHYSLGLDSVHLVSVPDKKRGKLMLKEIMKCGNMGKYDNRLSGKMRYKYPYFSKFVRGIKLGMYFPYEVWITPLLGIIDRKIGYCHR